ncbi:MAG: pyridoxamine 5'-phosphate oxidase family protein [Chloroflexi bacterium]|nr:pyridoxamine 5'-phosphate oxidase family protein [Chloroflexota bacterium]
MATDALTKEELSPHENRFTRCFGMPAERVQKKVLNFLNDDVKAFIARSPFLVMATSDPSGRCNASPRGGRPGFVKILDDRHLLLPDVKGNRLFQSYLNMDKNPHVGLLFMIPGSDRTVRVNGRVRILDKEDVLRHVEGLSIHNPDEDAVMLQGLLIEVEEAYGHCPRSFRFADLWNVETIAGNRQSIR